MRDGTAAPRLGIALAIVAKIPQPGRCKTRLVPPLTHRQAADLSQCFIDDTVKNVVATARATGAIPVVAYTPRSTEREVRAIFGREVTPIAQCDGSFGARLAGIVADLLARGHDGVCLIDSDSPTLPPTLLRRAVRALERGGDRLVIGPAIDGGYYLLGMKRRHPTLFENIEWSTSRVFSQTMLAASPIDRHITVLQPWYDVDDESGLRLIVRELIGKDLSGGYAAPQTRSFLATLPMAAAYLAEAPE